MELIRIASDSHVNEINMSDTETDESDKENIQNQVEAKVVKYPSDSTSRQFNTKLKVLPSTRKQKSEKETFDDFKKSRRKVRNKYQALLYDEPKWGGIPEDDYKFMVSENGVPLEIIDLSVKSSHILGSLQYCTIRLNHPTVSRYHAIIQYISQADDNLKPGMFIRDLDSSYGTFLNGHPISPNTYVQISDGDIIGFGYSQRTFVLLVSKNNKKKGVTKLDADFDKNTGQINLPSVDSRCTLKSCFEDRSLDSEYKTEFEGTKPLACSETLLTENGGKDVVVEVSLCDKKEVVVAQGALEACRISERECSLQRGTSRNSEETDSSTSSCQSDSSGSIQRVEIEQNNKLETMVQECASLMEKIKKLESSLHLRKYLIVDPFLDPAILKKSNIKQAKCILENLKEKEARLLKTNSFFNPPSKSLRENDPKSGDLPDRKLRRGMSQEEISALCVAFPVNERVGSWKNYQQNHNLKSEEEEKNPLWIFSENPNRNILLGQSQ